MSNKLTIKDNFKTQKQTSELRFVLQDDGFHILQQAVIDLKTGKTEWKGIPVIQQNDIPDYEPTKIEKKRLAIRKASE